MLDGAAVKRICQWRMNSEDAAVPRLTVRTCKLTYLDAHTGIEISLHSELQQLELLQRGPKLTFYWRFWFAKLWCKSSCFCNDFWCARRSLGHCKIT
jgi:hypothetical protein